MTRLDYPTQNSGPCSLVGSSLCQSEVCYRCMVELCPDAIAVHKEGRLLFVNNAGLDILGASSPEQVVGHDVLEFVHEDSRDRIVERVATCAPGQTVTLPNEKVVRLDGRTIQVEAIVAPIMYMGQTASQMAFRDVSSQRQAEEAMQRETSRLTAIIQTQADVAAADLDLQDVMRLVSERTARVTDAPAASVGLLEDGHIHYYHGNGLVEGHTGVLLPIEGGMTQLCLDTGETIYCRDSETDPRVNRASCHHLGMRSLISAPLRHDGASIGVLTIYSPEPYAFTDLDVRTMELMAGFVAAAMVRAAESDMRQTAEKALQRYRLLAENAHDIMVFMTLDGAIIDANEAAIQAYGYSREEICGITVYELRDAPRELIEAHLKQAALAPMVYKARHKRRNGITFPVEVSLQYKQIGGEHVLLGVARDTTERTAFEEQLEHQAFHDPLTELPNRALFMDRLRHALLASRERNRRIGLLFLDLDRFKVVNDSLGHHAGDQLLVAIAGRLRTCVRGTDTAARFGGDEFTILMADIASEGDVIRTAERVLRKLQAPFEINGQEVYVTASIGVAVSRETTLDPDQFLRDADVAMYQAKTSGRARHAVFACEMSTDTRERLQLETDLRRAIEREEFTVYYQPIVLMETRQTIGVEALVRWNHPQFGLMAPDAFVPLQEQIGLIEPFTLWVLREAQMQCLELQRMGMFLSFSVNLSVHNLLDPSFACKVGMLLSETGLSPAALKLEITESAVMMNPARALNILTDLNRQGIRLSIDDFGTGYSSLAYLKQLPVQEIKIDKSFVMGMDTSDDDDAAIVRATIDMAHNLRKKVVAEGVENPAAWELLNTLGCDAAQGFYMARPMPATNLATWLRESPFGLSDLFE